MHSPDQQAHKHQAFSLPPAFNQSPAPTRDLSSLQTPAVPTAITITQLIIENLPPLQAALLQASQIQDIFQAYRAAGIKFEGAEDFAATIYQDWGNTCSNAEAIALNAAPQTGLHHIRVEKDGVSYNLVGVVHSDALTEDMHETYRQEVAKALAPIAKGEKVIFEQNVDADLGLKGLVMDDHRIGSAIQTMRYLWSQFQIKIGLLRRKNVTTQLSDTSAPATINPIEAFGCYVTADGKPRCDFPLAISEWPLPISLYAIFLPEQYHSELRELRESALRSSFMAEWLRSYATFSSKRELTACVGSDHLLQIAACLRNGSVSPRVSDLAKRDAQCPLESEQTLRSHYRYIRNHAWPMAASAAFCSGIVLELKHAPYTLLPTLALTAFALYRVLKPQSTTSFPLPLGIIDKFLTSYNLRT